ncbi:MAG: ankyrin repeat domain-containing protein, partial [Hyphomonadaceae bacterium]|nr:ankyrin repeat domain-containing protein [Hyphomonadaceae bacterium]
MFRFLIIAALLGAGLYARSAWAQPDCNDWNSKGFFESATAADMRRCLAAGAEVEARTEGGETPLHWAAVNGRAETVAALVKAGAEVDARNEGGATPLHAAAVNGHAEAVTALTKAGAEVDVRNEGGATPLHAAAVNGHAEAVTAL